MHARALASAILILSSTSCGSGPPEEARPLAHPPPMASSGHEAAPATARDFTLPGLAAGAILFDDLGDHHREITTRSPEAQAFGEAFRKKYNEDPDTWAALGFDAVNMTLDGIAAAGADRNKLREWFTSRRDRESGVKGVTGVTYFDEHGDCPSKPAQVVVVRNGAFVLAEKQLPAE